MHRIFPLRFIVLAAVACTGTIAANAAEIVWLQPESARATPGSIAFFDAVSSDEFRGATQPLAPARVERTEGNLAGESVGFGPWILADRALRTVATFSRPGIATIVVRLMPEARVVSRPDVERYLVTLHAGDEVHAAWEQIEPPNPWQEIRTVVLKTYLRVGVPEAGDRSWAESNTSGLDLVPTIDPTSVHANDAFGVRVTRDGRPAAGIVVEYLSDGESREHVVVTGADGTASAPLNQAGSWLIRGFEVRRVKAGNHDWETTTVALAVVASK